MPREFRLEDPGEGIHEAEILEVEVEEGQRVEDGQIVLSVETDKAAVEVPAPFTGTVEEIRVEVGERVQVGEVLLTYTVEEAEEEGEEPADEPPDDAADEGEGEPAGDEAAAATDESDVAEADAAAPEEEGSEKPEGRAAAGRPDSDEEAPDREGDLPHDSDRPVPAAPATRRRARELEVDLHRVPGSGPGGRVTREDVERFAAEGAPEEAAEPGPEEEPAATGDEEAAAPEDEEAAAPEPGAPEPAGLAAGAPPELPDFERWGEVERTPLRSVRRTTAERMARSWRTVPHVTHMDVADVTELERFRRAHEDDVEEAGGKLTLMVLVMKAAVAALREHPRFNASLDPEAGEVVLKRYYHVGVAVDTDRGLLVPVVRDVDRKSVVELAVELTERIRRTREGEASPSEMRGGSFTVTNPGPIGGTAFTPIVNWPEVAILGMGRARLEPVARGDLDDAEIVPRLRLPLCLGFDHRVNDGADAARFVRAVAERLSDPDSFLLEV